MFVRTAQEGELLRPFLPAKPLSTITSRAMTNIKQRLITIANVFRQTRLKGNIQCHISEGESHHIGFSREQKDNTLKNTKHSKKMSFVMFHLEDS